MSPSLCEILSRIDTPRPQPLRGINLVESIPPGGLRRWYSAPTQPDGTAHKSGEGPGVHERLGEAGRRSPIDSGRSWVIRPRPLVPRPRVRNLLQSALPETCFIVPLAQLQARRRSPGDDRVRRKSGRRTAHEPRNGLVRVDRIEQEAFRLGCKMGCLPTSGGGGTVTTAHLISQDPRLARRQRKVGVGGPRRISE